MKTRTAMNDITQKIKNPLLEKMNKMPGETIRLPSKGLYYINGELDEEVKNGEITIYPMTTLDEIYMRHPDMLFRGTSIDAVVKRCVPQVKKPLELFANDIDYILTALRKVSYGNNLPITHKCEHCFEKTEKANEFEIPLSYFLQNAKEFVNDEEKMTVTLSNGFTVHLRPSKMHEMLELFQINEERITDPVEMTKLLALSLSATIKDVDGIENKELIKEWIAELPRNIIEEFSGKLSNVNNWGAEFKYKVTCPDCGGVNEISAVLNPLYFFILPSSQKTKKE